MGLGLAIVRHLVELHGGTVQAESAGSGFGAKFTVSFPLLNIPTPAELVPAIVRGEAVELSPTVRDCVRLLEMNEKILWMEKHRTKAATKRAAEG